MKNYKIIHIIIIINFVIVVVIILIILEWMKETFTRKF